jgi:hypothetical protein
VAAAGQFAFVTRGTHFSRGQHAASFSRWTFLDHAGRAGAVVDQHMLAEPLSHDVLLARADCSSRGQRVQP